MINNPPAMIGWLHVGSPLCCGSVKRPCSRYPVGRGFGEADDAVLAIEIKTVVSENQRPFPDAAIAPDGLAGIEHQRRQDAARKSIEMIADQHRRGVMVAHVAREVDLVRGRDDCPPRARPAARRPCRNRTRRTPCVPRTIGVAMFAVPLFALLYDHSNRPSRGSTAIARSSVKKITWLRLPVRISIGDE